MNTRQLFLILTGSTIVVGSIALLLQPYIKIIRHLAVVRERGSDEIEVHLPNASYYVDARKIARLEKAINRYYASIGVVARQQEKNAVEVASWHFYKLFERLAPQSSKEAPSVYHEGKEAVRRACIDSTGAESFFGRAKATAELLKAIKQFDEAILRLGDVVVAKATIKGKNRLVVETISPDTARVLEENPDILLYPKLYFGTFHRNPTRRSRNQKLLADSHIWY